MKTIEELKQAVAAAEAALKAEGAKLQKLKAYDRVANEGGEGYSTYEAASEESAMRLWPAIQAAKDALFAAEWTPESTAERRALWNGEISMFLKVRRNPTMREILAIQKKLGFILSDLKKALGK